MSTSPIIITPSTSVVLVNTADYSGNPVVLLPNLAGPGALGRIITVRDNDGGSVDPAKSIYLSTTGGAIFQPELSSITLSTIRITQPYGFITLTPRLTDPFGNTNYGLMNVYAFPEASPAAYINTFNANFSYLSTLSTANLAVSQDTIIQGNLTVGGGITYVNPGNTTLDIGTVNTNLISAATILNSNFYGVNAAVSTINTSSFVVRDAGSILLPNAGSWSNAASFAGATDPNSLTLGNPAGSAGAQIGLSSFFFGIRSFTSNADGDKFSTTIVMRDGTVGINLSEINNIGTLNNTLNYSLYVRGATQLSNLGVNNNILLLKTADTNGSNVEVNRFGTDSSNYRIDSSNNITEGFYHATNQFHWLTVDKNGSVKFWSGIGSRSSNLERVTIDNTGRMGVGTTAPAYTLDVSGELRVTGTSRLGPSVGPTIIGNDANAYMVLGRGRTTPGGSYIDFDISASITPGSGLGSRIIRYSGTDADFDIINSGNGNLRFATSNTNRMVIDSNGRVTIGTSGNDRFSVDENGGYFTQYNTATSNNNPSLRLENSPGCNKLEFYTNLGVGGYNSITQAGDKGIIFTNGAMDTGALVIAPWASGTKGIRIDSAGNVGIGATTPGYTLDVNGKIRIQNSATNRLIFSDQNNINKISLYGNDSMTDFMGFGVNPGILTYNVPSDNNHVFYVNGSTELMRIQGNGNVGIGCNAPSVKLDVNGNTKITGDLNVTGTITGTLSVVPTGCIMMWSASVVPTGWLFCNGSNFSSNAYPVLAGVLLDTYGTHSGDNYYLPDMRDRFTVGAGSSYSLNSTGGNDSINLTSNQMPAHTHTGTTDVNGTHNHPGSATNSIQWANNGTDFNPPKWSYGTSSSDSTNVGLNITSDGSHSHTFTTASAGGGASIDIRPKYIGINYIIKT